MTNDKGTNVKVMPKTVRHLPRSSRETKKLIDSSVVPRIQGFRLEADFEKSREPFRDLTPESERDDPAEAQVNDQNVVVLKFKSGVKDGEKHGERDVDGPACEGDFRESQRFHCGEK